MPLQPWIVKASGEKQPFSEDKLRRSLEKTKAPPALVNDVLEFIRSNLTDGMTTAEIYQTAFGLLKKSRTTSASRYALKRSIMELGPEGRFFEKYVGELVKWMGYRVEVAKIVEGHCVSHEVDVIGLMENRHVMVECKLHNRPGTKSDVKVALYVQARFEDLRKKWGKESGHGEMFHEAWLVTNTALTTDAIRYARCVGMKAIAWNYPADETLQDLIEKSGLHPVTCLTSMPNFAKKQLLEKGFILCKSVHHNDALLKELRLSGPQRQKLNEEIGALCKVPVVS